MEPLNRLIDSLKPWAPSWLLALLVLVAGLIAAFLIRLLLSRGLGLLRFNALCGRLGITEFLRKGEVQSRPSQLIGIGAGWATLLTTLFLFSRVLDLGVMEAFRRQLASKAAAFLGALVILGVGFLVVSFLSNFLRTVARNAGLTYAHLLAKVAKWIGWVFVLLIAVEQVDLGGNLLGPTFQILLTAVAGGAALAFGLGCKDLAREAAEKFILRIKEHHRDDRGGDLEG